MLRRSVPNSSLVATAVKVLSRNEEQQQQQQSGTTNQHRQYGLASTTSSKAPWIDRDLDRARAVDEHRQSEVYRELHRTPAKHSELGLYGGEPGFQTTPRVWVDPDNPHVKNIYNRAQLSVNMRWARYGHFKREMHIIDVDKLCRHARMLPPIDKLLTDFMTLRVALDDDGCSALIRHGARSLHSLNRSSDAEEYFERIQFVFQRFLVAIAPPMYAGVRTHSDMIRCCTLMKDTSGKWEEGYHQYRQRAVDEAADAKARRELMKAKLDAKKQQLNSNKKKQQLLMNAKKQQKKLKLLATKYGDNSILTTSTEKNDQLQDTNNNDNDDNDTTTLMTKLRMKRQNKPIMTEGDSLEEIYESQEEHPLVEVADEDDIIGEDGDETESGMLDPVLGNGAVMDITSESDAAILRSHSAHFFELDSEFYDAVIELCVTYDKHEECIAQLYELIESGHRPRISSLTNALVSAAHLKNSDVGDEIPRLVDLYKLSPTIEYFQARAAYAALVKPSQTWSNFLEALSTPVVDTGHVLKAGSAGARSAAQILELAENNDWTNASNGGSYATFGRGTSFQLLREGKAAIPSSRIVSWSLMGLAQNEECTNCGDVLKMLDLAMTKGVGLDYEHMTFALDFAVKKLNNNSNNNNVIPPNEIFNLIETIIHDRLPQLSINLTPEMGLLAMRALARLIQTTSTSSQEEEDYEQEITRTLSQSTLSGATSTNGAACTLAIDIMKMIDQSNNRASTHFPSVYYEFCQLLARCGVMGAFTSHLKNYVLARGETVQSWLLRSWLWCNSNTDKPNGSHSITREAVELMMMIRPSGGDDSDGADDATTTTTQQTVLTRELVMSLVLSRMKHGSFATVPGIEERLEKIVFDVDVDDESDNSMVEEKSLFETVEYFASLFSSSEEILFSSSSSKNDNNKNSSNNTDEKGKMLSLEESLDMIIGEQQKQENKTSTPSSTIADQLVEELIQNRRQNLLSSLGHSTSSTSSSTSTSMTISVYDACHLIAEDLLFYADAVDRRGSTVGQEQQQKQRSNLMTFAQILAGLPSEKQDSPVVASITQEFNVTPSTLRDLRVKYTLDNYDVSLRRQGQLPARAPHPPKITPYALQVQPFNENM